MRLAYFFVMWLIIIPLNAQTYFAGPTSKKQNISKLTIHNKSHFSIFVTPQGTRDPFGNWGKAGVLGPGQMTQWLYSCCLTSITFAIWPTNTPGGSQNIEIPIKDIKNRLLIISDKGTSFAISEEIPA